MRIPVTLAAEFRGLARKAGSFERQENGSTRTVEFTDAYKFETTDADGVLGEIVLSQKACDAAAEQGLDVAKLTPGTVVTIAGVVADGDGGMYVKPLRITKGVQAVKAA